jgi:CRISPR-associated protein Cas1
MPHPLYLLEQGSRLSREGRRLVVSKEGAALAQVATVQVSQVLVFGNIQLTTPALHLLLAEAIDVILLTQAGNFLGRIVGAESGKGALRVAQITASRRADAALHLAQQIVHAKIHNARIFLMRYARRKASTALDAAVEAMTPLLERTHRTMTLNSLMGVEGQATAIYFGVWKELLHAPWRFTRRIRRPPTDPVNVLLSFGYTILSQNMLSAIYTAGLDPYVGFLHQLDYNRPSLAQDLIEEFRAIIVDSVALRCLNNQIVTPDDFVPGDEEYPLIFTDDGKRKFIRELEARLTHSFRDPISGQATDYRRVMLQQVYRLAHAVQQEGLPTYPAFLVR